MKNFNGKAILISFAAVIILIISLSIPWLLMLIIMIAVTIIGFGLLVLFVEQIFKSGD